MADLEQKKLENLINKNENLVNKKHCELQEIRENNNRLTRDETTKKKNQSPESFSSTIKKEKGECLDINPISLNTKIRTERLIKNQLTSGIIAREERLIKQGNQIKNTIKQIYFYTNENQFLKHQLESKSSAYNILSRKFDDLKEEIIEAIRPSKSTQN